MTGWRWPRDDWHVARDAWLWVGGWVAHFLHRLLNGVKGVQKKQRWRTVRAGGCGQMRSEMVSLPKVTTSDWIWKLRNKKSVFFGCSQKSLQTLACWLLMGLHLHTMSFLWKPPQFSPSGHLPKFVTVQKFTSCAAKHCCSQLSLHVFATFYAATTL